MSPFVHGEIFAVHNNQRRLKQPVSQENMFE